jgi:ribulose-phosphate 3-epimerase
VLAAGTPFDEVDPLLGDADLVLVTWATPGPHGARFMPFALRWLRTLRSHVPAARHDVAISVDGGVDLDTAAAFVAAGADMLVVESALCRAPDRAGTIAALKGVLPRRRRAPGGGAPHPLAS